MSFVMSPTDLSYPEGDGSTTEEASRDHIQSIERCLSVIVAFTHAKSHLSFVELSKATGLSKPTVRRILLTLERLGYAQSVGSHFALTPKVLNLGYAYLSSLNLTEASQPLMEALTDQLGESTALAALDGSDVVYINRVHRHRISSMTLAIGTRLPAYAASSGHVLLADLNARAINDYFANVVLRALTEKTLITREALIERFALVRARGWDAVDQELEIGRRSAAAPIFDPSGKVVAALSVSCGTTDRSFEKMLDDFLPGLRETAQKIGRALGANGYAARDA
jgi:IclR family transcriptional regulator, pca regulon regulatory protein